MLAKWRLSLVGLVSIGYVSSANAGQTELLVPAYFYPSGSGLNDWARMSAVAPQVDLTAILNPNSGPGASVDPNYVAVDDSLRSAGGHVLGYVYSSYGARSLAAVEADIDSYLGMYGVDGFFIDEMASSPADHAYYKTLYNYIHAKSPNLRVVTNPGTSFDQSYLADPVADTVVSFEGSGSQYAGYSPDPWMSAYPARDFGHVVHTEAGVAAMLSDLQLAASRNAGSVFVTDQVYDPNQGLFNPYDQLPSYWDQEVAALAPEPGTLLVVGLGSALLLRSRKRSKPPAA